MKPKIEPQDLLAFAPELILCATIVFLLVVRLFNRFNFVHLSWVSLGMTVVAFLYALSQWNGGQWDPRSNYLSPPKALDMFAGLLVYDNFTIFLRLFLLGFTALILVLSLQTGIPDKEDSADFNVLLLGATLGMCVMASSNHLMMVFIGIEMASLPSYALAGFLKGRRQSSEAALKYVVYGGGAAGVMLYGISLISGKFGTGYLPEVAEGIRQGSLDGMILLGGLFLLIGIAFKLAAVPFHFWCPDVFEGAAAEVAGFLSVASKGAALALLGRFVIVLAGPPDKPEFITVAKYLVPAIAFFAAITATFGNLAAYGQTNLKRLLAYSTIAHAGYMMMGLATLTTEGAGAVLFYLVTYLFMNLGAFAIVAYLRNLTHSEDLKDFRGLIHQATLVLTLSIFLLSLLGIPPLAGFLAKFQIFSVIFESAQTFGTMGQAGLSQTMYALLVVGGLNTVISAMYYIKVMKVMILDKRLEEVEGRPVERLKVPAVVKSFAGILAIVIIGLCFFWNELSDAAQNRGVNGFPGLASARGHEDRGTAVIDRPTYLRLQDVIRREGRSFLQYAGESFPWNAPEDGATVVNVQELVREERDGAAALSRYLVKHRLTPPYLGAYPSYFTSYNFLSLDRLVPLLVEHQKRGILGLEADLKAIEDSDTHKQVQDILAMKRRHLTALEAQVHG